MITNQNKNIFFFARFSFLLGFFLIIFFLSFIPLAQAQWGNTDFLKGIVPCGTSYTGNTSCTVCHFYKLLQNIINFLLYASASLATLMAIFVGFLFLFSGGSPKNIQDAKGKLWLLVWGIGWVLGSWLVLNTIITFFADKSVFPAPWNQISCEVSQPSSTATSQAPTAPQTLPSTQYPGFANAPSPAPLGETNDRIATDTTIDVTQQGDTANVVITNSASGQTLNTSSQEDGAGIGLVRNNYKNVFVMGGDISMQDGEKLKGALDAAASMLPADYNIKDKIILVPTEQKLNADLAGVAGGGAFAVKADTLNGFVSNNNVVVLSDFANKFDSQENIAETIVHELAHVRVKEKFGAFSGDSEWDSLYTGIKQTVNKDGFITGITEGPTGFASDYAKTNPTEDLAESVAKATLALSGKAKAYTGDSTTDAVLQKKYEYLKKNGLIKDVPRRQ